MTSDIPLPHHGLRNQRYTFEHACTCGESFSIAALEALSYPKLEVIQLPNPLKFHSLSSSFEKLPSTKENTKSD